MKKMLLLIFILLPLTACQNDNSTAVAEKDENNQIKEFIKASEEIRETLSLAAQESRKLTIEEKNIFTVYLETYEKNSKSLNNIDFELIATQLKLLESALNSPDLGNSDLKQKIEDYNEVAKSMITEAEKEYIDGE